eukprot:4190486-Prymnesium_polylepis.1
MWPIGHTVDTLIVDTLTVDTLTVDTLISNAVARERQATTAVQPPACGEQRVNGRLANALCDVFGDAEDAGEWFQGVVAALVW